MSTLYNCHHDGDQYRITKFVDSNPESSYLCTFTECECPAGSRDTCRHRQMLPTFLDHTLVNTPWFIDWDRKSWPCDFEGNVVTPAIIDLPAEPAEDTLVNLPLEGELITIPTADGWGAKDITPAKPGWRRL